MSAVARGRSYEEGVLRLLTALGMRLALVGGRGDGGVDLRGRWGPSGANGCAVAVQCKRIARPCPPSVVRELEGTVQRMSGSAGNGIHLPSLSLDSMHSSTMDTAPRGSLAPSSSAPVANRHPPTQQPIASAHSFPLAVLAVSTPASDAARAAIATSPIPIVYMHIPLTEPTVAGDASTDREDPLSVTGAIVNIAAYRAFPLLRVGSRKASGTTYPTFQWACA